MHKFFLVLLLFAARVEAHTHVLVSIAPQKFLAEWIGGEEVAVEVIVPVGANAHTYEPSTRQVLAVQEGEIWFRMGEGFENRLAACLKHTTIIDQREGLDLIQAGCGCCGHDAHDPHIWLSPRMLKSLAGQMAAVLSAKDPEHAALFLSRLHTFCVACDKVDAECADLLKSCAQKTILVSHPAFGYFCRDYGLQQLSIEMEGREPTPKYLTRLIEQAHSLGLKTVFLQQQHNPKGGKRIAHEIGAETVYVDPYREDVLTNLRDLAELFAHA